MRPAEPTPQTRRHGVTVIVIWVVLSLIAMAIASRITMPPGDLSIQAEDQSKTIMLLTLLAAPVFMGVVVFMVYSIVNFRQSPGAAELESGPPVYGDVRVQVGWVAVSAVLVLAMAVYGTVTLVNSEAAKAAGVPGRTINSGNATEGEAGEGPPPGGNLIVQVLGQQWYFTYRFPQYGGVETTHLMLPENTRIEFHVTSLDVIHSFWAYQLGVKADAVPGNDNQAFATTEDHAGQIEIRCAELCGLWHGEMADSSGQVVSQSDFNAWIRGEQQYYASTQKDLPPYSGTYYPVPLTKGS